MKNIRIGLYIIVAVYTFSMFIIGFVSNDITQVNIFFNELKGQGQESNTFYGINTTLKTVLLYMSASFFFISYLISKGKKNSEKKLLFYLTQIIFFIVLGSCVRFHIYEFVTPNKWGTMLFLGSIELLLIYFVGDFKEMLPKLKKKIYWCVTLLVLTFISNYLFAGDSIANIVVVNLLLLWIYIFLISFSFDIMYNKIQKLKKISNKFYREQQLKKNIIESSGSININ